MPLGRREYCEFVPRSPKLANRLSKQTPHRPLYITIFSRLNAGPTVRRTLIKSQVENCRFLNKRQGRLIEKIRYARTFLSILGKQKC